MYRTIATLSLLTLFAQPGSSQCPTTFTETFDAPASEGGWTWGTATEVVLPAGGNPGAYRRANIDTFAPQPRTEWSVPSGFHGDFRARGVTSVGIDLQTFSIDFPSSCANPLSVVLDSDMGTPFDSSDDCFVYFVGSASYPCLDGQWHSYDFAVPSSSTTLPSGWAVDPNCTISANAAWNTVVQDVDRVRFFYGDPTFLFIFQMFDVGMDNPRITTAGPLTYCVAQLNSQGCFPSVSTSGVPSATSPTNFLITATNVINNKNGLLFYGYAPNRASFLSGTLCVRQPIRRTGVGSSAGNPPPDDCSGTFVREFNALIQGGGFPPFFDPGLVAGAQVYTQYWSRDPASASTTNLTDAATFVICP